MSVWCLILLTANMCMCAFADVGAIPLRVDGGGFDEGQVSPRRERLVQLLAELIERHGPLGLWTHPDEGFQVASGGGERGSSSSWLGGDGGRGGGDVYGRANAPTNRGVSSASVSGRPAHRPRIDYDASDFYDRSDERPATEYRSRGGAGAREPKGKKTLSREYTEPQPPSSRGSNVPSRGDGGDRGDDHGRPITINRDRYRDSYSRDNYNRPGGGARSGNVFGPRREGIAKGHASPQPGEGDGSIRRYSYGGHITIGSDRYRDSYSRDNYNRPGGGARSGNVFDPRREGIAKGDTSFQPGEDCDEDEDIDTSDEDSLVNDQRSSFKSSNVYLGPVPRTSRPKSSRLNRPSGSRGSNVPSRGDGSDRGDGHGRPITIGSDRYRDSYSRDNYNRPGGGARSGNVFGPRREGIAKGHASLQPGEDCDEDESVDSIEEYSPSITQRVESSNQYRGSASRPDRPKSSKVYKPSGARSAIPYPSMFLEPPFNPASPSSTANAAIGTSIYLPPLDAKGSEVVEVLLKNWQEEIREKRDNVMREVAPSKNEYDSYSYSDYDEGPSEVVPETPLWRGSYKLRGALSAPLAGYTETYTMWYNGDTGESRLDFNGGTALSLRLRLPNGSYRLLSTERMELPEGTKRMCRVGTGMISSPKEMGPPALPDMKAFKFAGWLSGAERSKVGASSSDGRVERWQREVRVKEHAPENQTSEEENLTYRHEMVVVRRSHGAVPLRYSVYVDSSHLGVASDAYMHTYREFEHLTSPQEHLNYNLETGCDVQEQANISDLEHRAALEPLREFTEESRSPLYSIMLARYKIRFVRRYYNFKEDVLRRNILMQKARFVGCVNRRGETFRLEINFLADRLKAEVAQLFGALPFPHGAVTTASVPFPYDRSTLRRRARTLPRAFDWREKGAIGPVEFQGTCMSCWAFAVTAAIEGGLFAHTGHKRTLSKQCLVDCGHDTNANGCAPTWPKYAYEYVRRHGLPTNSSYPYTGQKKECTSAGLSPIVSIRGYVDVTNHSVNALKVSIYENGPVVVIIDAKSQYFQLYSSGVLDDPECGKLTRDTNHAVLAVGWGEENGKTYFILKNSWSQSWGDGGYVKFNGFTNTCGVLTQPSYPLEPRLEGKAVAGSSAENDYVR